MSLWCYLLVYCLAAIVVLYGLLELHYFMRMCLCVLLARFVKRQCHILDTTSVTGLCLSNDIDTLLYHMNNARYLRELDFARVDFYERTKLYRTIVAKGGSVFQGAATIRYRRFIRPFHRFIIASRIIYWDDQSVYMEHRFLRPADQFVHSIAICRQRIINCSAEEVMRDLLATKSTAQLQSATSLNSVSPTNSAGNSIGISIGIGVAPPLTTTNCEQVECGQVRVRLKPSAPPEILKWIEYNDLSSKNLRKGC